MKNSHVLKDLAFGGMFRRINLEMRAVLKDLAAAMERTERLRGSGNDRLNIAVANDDFAVIPVALAQTMPDDWQNRAADLLAELDEAFPNAPKEFVVNGRDDKGRMSKLPDAFRNRLFASPSDITEFRAGADKYATARRSLRSDIRQIIEGASGSDLDDIGRDHDLIRIDGVPDDAFRRDVIIAAAKHYGGF